jgi:hypothetical protein
LATSSRRATLSSGFTSYWVLSLSRADIEA